MNWNTTALPLSICLLVAAGIQSAPPATLSEIPPVNPKLDPDNFRDRLYGSWIEVERTDAGEAIRQNDMYGHQYGPNDSSRWLKFGESTRSVSKGGIRINAKTSPMQLDIYIIGQKGVIYIVPCIFKFREDSLILVVPEQTRVPLKARASGEYPVRPKNFTSTKENKYSLRVMKPTVLYGTNPIKKPKH